MTPDPILERLDAIVADCIPAKLSICRVHARMAIAELLADVAIEHYNRGHAGDLGRWAESCAAIRERFGVPAADKDAALDDQRCAVCGWTLAVSRAVGCVRGNCSMRPRPARLYDPVRAEMEEMSNQPKEGT